MNDLIAASTITNIENLLESIDRLTTTAEAFPYTKLMPDKDVGVDQLREYLDADMVKLVRIARMPVQSDPEDYIVIKGKPVFRVSWVGDESWGERNMRVVWWAQAPISVARLSH